MAITIRQVATNTNDGSSATISVTTDASPQVGDVLLVIHSNNFYDLADMPTPTVSPTSNALAAVVNGTADAGANSAHIKTYTVEVNVGGAQTLSVTELEDANEEKALVAYVLGGVNVATPTDGAANATDAGGSANQVAPSVSPGTTDALLVCVIQSGGGSSTASYTTPGGMTERYEHHVGGLSGVGATEQLATSGATGTRTFVAASATPWAAVSVAVRAEAVATATPRRHLVVQQAVNRAGSY